MGHPAVELTWSTFVLEIINFLVLVWILKRFLYQPVLDVIARRRAGIEKVLADARALHADAEQLQKQYEGRLAEWDQERQQARADLARELDAERTRKMAELQTSLEQAREKARVTEEHRQADAMRKIEETALVQGSRFAARLLEQASGPDTEARLVDLVIAELSRLPSERIVVLHNSYGKTTKAIEVISAFPLADEQRKRLTQALAKVTSADTPLQFKQDNKLVAGVRITIGAWVLGANIRDELKGFMELVRHE
jgi:F-type H+-transporting ATPase subunit b